MALLDDEGKTENQTTKQTKGLDADVVQIGDYTFQVTIEILNDKNCSLFIIRATEITTKDVFEFKRDKTTLLSMNWPNRTMDSVKQFITSTIFDPDEEMTVLYGFVKHTENDDEKQEESKQYEQENMKLSNTYEEGDDMVISIELQYKWMKSAWELDLKYIPQDEVNRLKVLVKELRDDLNMKSKELEEMKSFMNGFKGMITMWSGKISDIPKGWAICDGQNGTPNLTDRFILGNNGNNIGNTDGNKTHSHTITVNGHRLSVNEIPAHSHNMQFSYHNNFKFGSEGGHAVSLKNDKWEEQRYQDTSSAGGNRPHSHQASSNATNHMPPYYVLGFIMKL